MPTYARIENGKVAELLETDGPIEGLFHPSLLWVECSSKVRERWSFADGLFAPPPPADPPPEPSPADIIEAEERATMLPRVVREFMLGYMEANATSAQLAKNPGYTKVKALDDRIKELRARIK